MELCFINTHTHTHTHNLIWAPSSLSKQQVPVRCVWWGRVTHGYVYQSDGCVLCATIACLSFLVVSCVSSSSSLFQSLPVVLYRSVSRPQGELLDLDSGQMTRYKKVRVGDEPESGLTCVGVISRACSRCSWQRRRNDTIVFLIQHFGLYDWQAWISINNLWIDGLWSLLDLFFKGFWI